MERETRNACDRTCGDKTSDLPASVVVAARPGDAKNESSSADKRQLNKNM